MQCKVLILTLFTIVFSYTSWAQPRKASMDNAPMKITKVDSFVIRKAAPPKKPNTPANNPACCYPIAPADKNTYWGYKKVPLAGEKASFGNMNEYVNSFVHQYLSLHNKTLNYVQDKGNTSFPVVDDILSEHNLPKELKYLAVIESALNNNAVSHAGAVGSWQFMSPTAKLMGLNVSRRKDERRDLVKSTNAAAKYLSQLYGQLNDWLLVIAAYNSGPTPVQRAIEKTGSSNFWDIKQYLPRETQGHVLAFIATATIFERLSSFIGLEEIPEDLSIVNTNKMMASEGPCLTADAKKEKPVVKSKFTDEELKSMALIRINEPVNMEFMAGELKIDKKLLARWNPDYDLFVYNTYPTPYYTLRLPKEKLETFIQKREFLLKRSKQIFSELSM